MRTTDPWGEPLSTSNPATAEAYAAAVLKFAGYQADPLADIDAMLAREPGFLMGHLFRAGMLCHTLDKAFLAEAQKSLAAADALAERANGRERMHLAAVAAWIAGDTAEATELWGRAAMLHPRDLAAIQFAHLGDFAHGFSHMLRDRIARVLPAWSREMPGYGFLLGMAAFGHEESGDYARGEALGREAVALNPQDGWGVHAVAHVMEMQGRAGDGVAWLAETEAGWTRDNLFAFHNWWHLALFRLETEDFAGALALHDGPIGAGGFGQPLELVDGTALLWRLSCLGLDVGPRWTAQAQAWADRIADDWYAFNDVHGLLAFIGAGRRDLQDEALRALTRAAGGSGTNAMMARDVGLPAARGFAAFARGAYAEAVTHLLRARPGANRFGGSHAQRDILSWTACEAAIRSGERRIAEALAAERLAAKPASPLNRAWMQRARALALRQAA